MANIPCPITHQSRPLPRWLTRNIQFHVGHVIGSRGRTTHSQIDCQRTAGVAAAGKGVDQVATFGGLGRCHGHTDRCWDIAHRDCHRLRCRGVDAVAGADRDVVDVVAPVVRGRLKVGRIGKGHCAGGRIDGEARCIRATERVGQRAARIGVCGAGGVDGAGGVFCHADGVGADDDWGHVVFDGAGGC